jgi:hypothetical protein
LTLWAPASPAALERAMCFITECHARARESPRFAGSAGRNFTNIKHSPTRMEARDAHSYALPLETSAPLSHDAAVDRLACRTPHRTAPDPHELRRASIACGRPAPNLFVVRR